MLERGTVISRDERYRYQLYRDLGLICGRDRPLVFVMLNPSTADHAVDDPTIRRCRGFAKAWGHAEFWVVNLFAFRATNPKELRKCEDPVGPENERFIRAAARHVSRQSGILVCAWGGSGGYRDQDRSALRWLQEEGAQPHYLKLSREGDPCHPLYLKKDLQPTIWAEAKARAA